MKRAEGHRESSYLSSAPTDPERMRRLEIENAALKSFVGGLLGLARRAVVNLEEARELNNKIISLEALGVNCRTPEGVLWVSLPKRPLPQIAEQAREERAA